MNIPEIQLTPPVLETIGPISITNAIFSAGFVSVVLIVLAIVVNKKLSLIPGRLQIVMEIIIGFWLEKLELASSSKKQARRMLPIIVTVFLFLVISNQLMLTPFLGSILFGEEYLFKTPTAHFSLPIALILMWLGLAHVLAFTMHPFKYVGNFFKFHLFFKIKRLRDLPMAFMEFFLGLMDIIGEIAKFVSTSARLFGNMFAGEIIIAVISGLLFITQFIVPIPFIVLGILSGFVQAFVFTMLLTVFMNSTLNNVKTVKEND